MPTFDVCNLEFPRGCRELLIHGHKFVATDSYPDDIKRLSHLTGCISDDVRYERNIGSNVLTARVHVPEVTEPSILEWSDNGTALNDVLLLLSLFTGREVVATDNFKENPPVLVDPRQFPWGATLECSLPYQAEASGERREQNAGFENAVNGVYEKMRDDEWSRRYERGYFLLLAKNAFQQRTIESAFIHCWTIWEHLFSLLNRHWLSDEHIRKLDSTEKISFVLTQFAIRPEINRQERARIKDLSQIRNRLIHYGRIPPQDRVHDDAELFIRLTEHVVLRILGLLPSRLFNTLYRLEEYLNAKQKQQSRNYSNGP